MTVKPDLGQSILAIAVAGFLGLALALQASLRTGRYEQRRFSLPPHDPSTES